MAQKASFVGAPSTRVAASFWLLGVLNNSAYVIMLAGADAISAGSVGLVFLCAVFPAMAVKLSAPYWFDAVSYRSRMILIATLMVSSYSMVASSSQRRWQLCGVVISAIQGGIGESSCLGLCSFYGGRGAVSAWSSGTGFAGIAGYTWVITLSMALGLSMHDTLLLANASAVMWLAVCFVLLEEVQEAPSSAGIPAQPAMPDSGGSSIAQLSYSTAEEETSVTTGIHVSEPSGREDLQETDLFLSSGTVQPEQNARFVPWRMRFEHTKELWPYMAPLFLVFASEYAMQSGVWAAIGTDAAVRHRFYEAANWCYQAGVFISRSSGMLYQSSRRALWLMPAVQIFLLLFFIAAAAIRLSSYWLLLPAFTAGLLGGAVYVNAFMLICLEVSPARQEFALTATSVADSVGIALGDCFGIVIQGCLFRAKGWPGADFACRWA